MPELSVILDNFNYAEYLPQAIESVLEQTFDDYELIIVDDGSTDDSLKIIRQYAEISTKIIPVTKANGGQTSAFNVGFSVSQGRIIALLDSDDYWYPQKLEKIVESHKSSKIVQHYLTENGNNVYRKIAGDVDWSYALTKFGFMYQHSPTSALSFHREVIEPFFPLVNAEEMRGYSDGCILMLAMTYAKISCLNEVLGFYRVHGKNLNANHTDSGAELLEVSIRQRNYVNKQLALRNLPELPYDNGQYIDYLLSTVDFDDKPAAIYGTGNSGERVAETLKRFGVPVWGFAASRSGNYSVTPGELFNHRMEFGKVVIASSAQEAIADTLYSCGFNDNAIVKLAI
ncbi:hypothetical protein AGMMS50276_29960 [Synergistales bacterium]|nr:hypothetical protein AGMMS50276_29960 [Synergistales bacterium]